MGLDWITLCAPSWKRSWDRGLQSLAKPDLFSPDVPEIQRSFRARPLKEAAFMIGEEFNLRLDGERIVVYRGLNEPVGNAENPPMEMVRAIRENGHSHAVGVVAYVHPLSGAADISVR
jgi:hypothetical protein